MRNIMILSVAGLFLFITGCASNSSILPANGSESLKLESEFGVLTAQPDVYQGRAIRMAGRMVGVETTTEGTIVTAEWLPYPKNEFEGPADGVLGKGKFTLMYPGKLDSEGRLHGNKFLVVGKIEGGAAMATVGGPNQNLPHIKARCLHVWKTGDGDIEAHQVDVENTGYPVMEETYCAKT